MIVSDSTQSSRKSRQSLQSTKPQAKKQISPLRQRMIRDMELAGYTRGTQQSYIGAVAKLQAHYAIRPDKLTEKQVLQYIFWLRDEKKVASEEPRDDCAHPGYISWQQYQDNCRTLRACAQAHGQDRRNSPPGQGPALLQGLVVCGVCGRRMTVRYHQRAGNLVCDYLCQHERHEHGQNLCQQIPGSGIDRTVGNLLLEKVQPVTLELAFAVQAELQTRLQEVDHLRQQQVKRARYEAELARSTRRVSCGRPSCFDYLSRSAWGFVVQFQKP